MRTNGAGSGHTRALAGTRLVLPQSGFLPFPGLLCPPAGSQAKNRGGFLSGRLQVRLGKVLAPSDLGGSGWWGSESLAWLPIIPLYWWLHYPFQVPEIQVLSRWFLKGNFWKLIKIALGFEEEWGFVLLYSSTEGFPWWLSGKESSCQCRRCRRHRFDSWEGKIPWRRKWQPAPVFLPGESHGQRSLVGCNPQGHEESATS